MPLCLLRPILLVLSRRLRSALLILAAALPSVAYAQEQTVYDVSIRALANRRELTALADSLEREVARSGMSGRRRSMMRADIVNLRQRLTSGDMVPGDRILLRIQSETPKQDTLASRPDTVIVSSETTLQVPGLAPISLRGVLRSEVESHIRDQIHAVIRNARISAVPLVSIGVLGSVTRPGYFFVPVTASITEAVMAAGGPLGDADPNGLVLQRGGRERWNRATMTAAAQQQVTLASLGTVNGDALFINKVSAPLDRTFLLGVVGFVLQSALIVSQLGGSR